jgi:hypothetical protein
MPHPNRHRLLGLAIEQTRRRTLYRSTQMASNPVDPKASNPNGVNIDPKRPAFDLTNTAYAPDTHAKIDAANKVRNPQPPKRA